MPFGTRLTDIAKLPPGSTVDIHDHYAEKSAVWPKVVAVVVFVGWLFLLVWDVGLLYSVTKYWSWGPVGKPPSWQAEKKDKTTPPTSEATNAAKLAK